MQARDIALVVAERAINIMCRGSDGAWRYVIALHVPGAMTAASAGMTDHRSREESLPSARRRRPTMSMGVSIVTYPVDPQQAEELHRRVREYLVPAARQVEGYRGFLLLDQGDNQRLALLIFESIAGAQAAQQVLGPIGREQTYTLMTGPAIGALGTAVIADGIFADQVTP
jgi:hypothetical protein